MTTGSRVILVIGIHRSGTSLVSGILHHLGVYMGKPSPKTESDTLYEGWPAYPSNPKGQFEDANFCSINRSLIGPNWRNPQPQDRKGEGFVEIFARTNSHQFWGLKDPATCFTWKIWVEELQKVGHEVGALFVRRGFEASVKSLMTREKSMPRPVAEHILTKYWVNFAEAAGDIPKTLVYTKLVHYEKILEEPREQIQSIHGWVYQDMEKTVNIEKAVEFVDPELNHGN